MITLNALLFWAILSVIFIAGFLTCSLLCINDLKPRLTQTPEEAAKDESHSSTREEQHIYTEKEQTDACRLILRYGDCIFPYKKNCLCSQDCPGPDKRTPNWYCYDPTHSAIAWLAARGLPIEEPPK